jgi:hypothetical protein
MTAPSKRSLAEILAIVGTLVTVVGGMLVFAANATDRIALMEERIARLTADFSKIEHGDPLVNARLTQQRADLEKLERRVDALQRQIHNHDGDPP